jgi:hypothetical protein
VLFPRPPAGYVPWLLPDTLNPSHWKITFASPPSRLICKESPLALPPSLSPILIKGSYPSSKASRLCRKSSLALWLLWRVNDIDLEALRDSFIQGLEVLDEDQFSEVAIWRDLYALTGTLRTFYTPKSIIAAWKATSGKRNPVSLMARRRSQLALERHMDILHNGHTDAEVWKDIPFRLGIPIYNTSNATRDRYIAKTHSPRRK